MTSVISAVRRSVTAHWQLKAALSVILTLFFCVPYFTLQRLPLFPVRRLTLGWIDQAIGFMPAWVWVYQSVYVLLSVVPWLAVSAHDLRRYARGFMLQSSIGFAVFLLLPIEGPRPSVTSPDLMFRVLVSYDGLLNSFPSLHVGLSVYTVLFAADISRGRLPAPFRQCVLALLAAWAAAIAFAALATKQHYAVDLPAGALLAWLCYRITTLLERSMHVETIRPGSSTRSLDPVRQLSSGLVAAAGDAAATSRSAPGGFGEPTGRSGSPVAAGTPGDLRAGDS